MTLPPQPTDAAVRSQPPPRWLMNNVVNPTARRLVPSPLGRLVGLVLLRFTGRRSGRHYEIPVVGHHVDDPLLVFTDAAWALNFHGGRSVTVIERGRSWHGEAHLIDDPAETATAMRRVLEKLRSPRLLGLDIDAGHQPSDSELVAVRRLIAIRTPCLAR